MARKKKDGRRATGIQAKKGMLYIIITENVIRDGKKVNEKKWISTGMPDTPENVLIASEKRSRISRRNQMSVIDRDILMPAFVDCYLDKKQREVADTTFSGYYYRGRRVKRFYSEVKVREITRADVEQFLDHLFQKEHLAPKTVKDTKTTFGAIMEMAVAEGIIRRNPVKESTINRTLANENAQEKDPDDEFFSYEEIMHFLKIIEDHPLYELFYTAFFFGLRREEVLGIRWSSVNFGTQMLTINHTVTKGTKVNRQNTTKTSASVRSYPLTDDQIRLFRHLKNEEEKNRRLFGHEYEENEYVFKHKDGTLYHPDYPTKAFLKIKRAHPELPQHATLHKLRSSCVSLLVHEGFDVKRAQKWVGHSDPQTTLRIYAKVKDKESKQEVLSIMGDIIRPKDYRADSGESSNETSIEKP